ncbi:MAG: hypothetical protein ACF8XB_09765 [Planctomycetota bacterium JB042]
MSYLGPIGIQQLPHLPQKGVTVGTYGADFNGGTDAAIAAAIDSLPDEGGVVELLHGRFLFRSTIEVTKPNVWIRANPAVKLTPAHSGAIGLFDASADGFGLVGAHILVSTFVNDQAVVEVSGKRARIEQNLFEVAATNGINSNPMRLLYLNVATEPFVFGNRFLPANGVDVIRCLYGHGPLILNNFITNNQDAEPITLGFTPRFCRRVFDLHHVYNARIIGNRMWALGIPTAFGGPTVDRVLAYQHESDLNPRPEAGHLEFRSNHIESVCATSYLEFRGIRWADIEGNEFGTSIGEIKALGDAVIVLLSEDGAGGGIVSDQVHVVGNRFHNVALVGVDAAAIYAEDATDLAVQGNVFSNMQSLWSIVANTDGVPGMAIQGNKFSAGATAPTAAIRLLAGSSANYSLQGNCAFGFPLISKAGAITGAQFDDGLIDTSTGNPPGGGASPANLSTNVEL